MLVEKSLVSFIRFSFLHEYHPKFSGLSGGNFYAFGTFKYLFYVTVEQYFPLEHGLVDCPLQYKLVGCQLPF